MAHSAVLSNEVEILSPNVSLKPELKKVSVFFERNLQRPHMFYCINCGTPILQYQGQIISLIPGDANSNEEEIAVIKVPIIIRCKHGKDNWGVCKTVYFIEGWAL